MVNFNRVPVGCSYVFLTYTNLRVENAEWVLFKKLPARLGYLAAYGCSQVRQGCANSWRSLPTRFPESKTQHVQQKSKMAMDHPLKWNEMLFERIIYGGLPISTNINRKPKHQRSSWEWNPIISHPCTVILSPDVWRMTSWAAVSQVGALCPRAANARPTGHGWISADLQLSIGGWIKFSTSCVR